MIFFIFHMLQQIRRDPSAFRTRHPLQCRRQCQADHRGFICARQLLEPREDDVAELDSFEKVRAYLQSRGQPA